MAPDRPNVLLVVADDLRAAALRNEAVETPSFDRLAGEGTTFTRAHNMGSDTGAVCVPARSMLHSGRSLFRLEGPGGMTEAHPTLGEAFGDAGYRTFGTGKWHNGTAAFNRSFDEGRDVFFGGMGDHWNVPVSDRHPAGEYPTVPSHPTDMGTGRVVPGEQVAARYAAGTHSTELFADAAIEFLRAAAGGEAPVFAAVATMEPHDPRTPPGEFLARYDHRDVSLPENAVAEHPFDTGDLDVRDERLAARPRDPTEVRRHVADYYASVTHLDHHLGRLLDALEATGLRADTVVAVTADHGLAVGQHGLMGKQNLYDHSVRVPLVLSGPGVPAGETRDALCYQCDLNPTLRDLADLPVPADLDAESLAPVLGDADADHRDAVVAAYRDCQRMVRGERYKLVEYAGEADRTTQLFDLAADPAETASLADDPAHRERRDRLRQRLVAETAALGGSVPDAFLD